MKTKSTFAALLLCVFALFPAGVQAQTNNLTVLLQQGLFEEQANRNLDAAIADYTSLATQFDKDRQLAATAVFRLGECYRAQGKTNEAAAQYQRILKDFSDEQTLVTLSRQDLTGMGVAAPKSFTERGTTGVTSQRTRELELVKKLQAMPLAEVRQVAPTLLTDGTLINLINQYNQCELDLVRLRVDYAEENLQVKRTVVIRDEMGKKIMERLEGLSHAISLDLAASENVTDTSAEANSKPVTDEEETEIVRIQQMIQNSPDLFNARVDGRTPLAKAAASGWLKVATYLMDHGAEVKGSYALSAAVEVGNRAMVELLLSRGADVNEMDNTYGRTLLQTAVGKGYQSVAEVLLANKADVNAQAGSGDTALTTAASVGQAKIVKMLLVAGANPNAANNYGRTPLSFAAERGPLETVKLLLDAKADPNGGKLDAPLLCAINNKDAASAELLLQAGANPNAVGEIDLPVRPNSQELANHGRHLTLLWLATYMKQLPMVQLLLKFKADPNDSQTDGQSLLFSALSDTNILEALLTAGAKVDPTLSDVRGWTPLAAAIAQNNTAAITILLQHGANPNARSKNGMTPLHWAADSWSPDTRAGVSMVSSNIFELLLADKADPNVRDNNGQTPLDMFKRFHEGPPEVSKLANEFADLLRQHGALDKLPDWDRIMVSRPSANFSQTVFQKGTNDWNQFTLLEMICGFDQNDNGPHNPLAFADLSHIVIVRPSAGGVTSKRIEVNLLNTTNGVDCAKDIPLEFGDVVEIPEREHTLAEPAIYLPKDQFMTIFNYLRSKAGEAKLIVAGGQTVQLPLQEFFCRIGEVLTRNVARGALTSSSDLSRVKVTRRDVKTGKNHEWIVDCSDHQLSANGNVVINNNYGVSGGPILMAMAPIFNGGNPQSSSDLWLRDGDVIEVPEKP